MKPPPDSVRREAEPARPRWIVTPRYVAGAPARLEPVPKARAFMQLVESAFNYDLHGQSGFGLLAGLIASGDCYEFTYASLDEAVTIFERLAGA
jgi:hypothetical protein